MDLESLNLQIAPYSKMKPMILFMEHATEELKSNNFPPALHSNTSFESFQILPTDLDLCVLFFANNQKALHCRLIPQGLYRSATLLECHCHLEPALFLNLRFHQRTSCQKPKTSAPPFQICSFGSAYFGLMKSRDVVVIHGDFDTGCWFRGVRS